MLLAVDAMGGDNGPKVTVRGSIDATKEYGIEIALVGKKEIIERELQKYEYDTKLITIVDARETIENEDKPVIAIRRKKDSSMVVALRMVKEKRADGIISAGNTGALLSGGLLIVGRIKGIERAALAPVYPTRKGISLLLDAGANTDSKPKYLYQFSVMGSVYAERVLGINRPKIGLVNIGTEEEKGNELTKEAFKLLKNAPIHFYGNIEAREIPTGMVDVLVCDGFVGNTILKLTEGLASQIFAMLKEEFTKSVFTKFGALILKPGLKGFKKRMDYTEYGGAPLLGVKGAVIKAHGSSDAKAIKNAIRQAKLFIEKNVLVKIEEDINKLGGNDDTE